jgi:asparagine synthase (glutamine-hydrolysing)
MCGIAGIIELQRKAGSTIDTVVARRMVDRLLHRGPDHGDVHLDGRVALGHRRLAVIDLATGNQPMFNEDGNVCVVFNGEIYNFQEIAKELKALGHHFKTSSDTEVVVHGWEQWGVDCLSRFRGMFAFVLWDKRQSTVFVARDRLGVKPLFYSLLPNGQFLFGSELKALEAHPSFNRKLDNHAVENYLALGYVPEPQTIYHGALKLPAAHYLLFKLEQTELKPQRYWQLSYAKQAGIDAVEAQRELDRLLEESVRLRLIADVPLGAFLSGGVDSSVVVAMMSRINPNVPVTTCSIGFDVPEYDESEFAKQVALHCRTNHVTRIVTADDLELVDLLPSLFDEPFSDSSALPSYRVAQIARERVTVSLSGDGGDETFGGYRRYRLHLGEERARAAIPSWMRKNLIAPAAAAYPEWGWLPRPLRAKTTLTSISQNAMQGYFRAMCAIPDATRTNLYSDSFKSSLSGYSAIGVFEQAASSFAGSPDSFDFIQHIDLQTWLSGDINVKADRTSMAHSLEVREPLLDHVLMEWAASLPQALKVSPSGAKLILKEQARRMVPPDVVDRPKQGFSVPMERWFKGPLAARLEAMLSGELATFVNPISVRTLLNQHRSGARNHDRALWTVFSLGNFLQAKGSASDA